MPNLTRRQIWHSASFAIKQNSYSHAKARPCTHNFTTITKGCPMSNNNHKPTLVNTDHHGQLIQDRAHNNNKVLKIAKDHTPRAITLSTQSEFCPESYETPSPIVVKWRSRKVRKQKTEKTQSQPKISHTAGWTCNNYLQRWPNVNYLKTQPHIDERMRTVVLHWLVGITGLFKLSENTLHLAITLLDRSLGCTVKDGTNEFIVKREMLQCHAW